MSCGEDTVPGDEEGRLKVKGYGCCSGGCITTNATLSGYVQDSSACGTCFGNSSVCQTNVSAFATDSGNSCGPCCGEPACTPEGCVPDPAFPTTCVCIGTGLPCDCEWVCSLLGGPYCVLTTCSFVGCGLGCPTCPYDCGNVICAGATTGNTDNPPIDGAVICESDPMTFKYSDCVGGFLPCGEPCTDSSECPPSISPCIDGVCGGICEGSPCVGGLCAGGPNSGTACRACDTEEDCAFSRECVDGECAGCGSPFTCEENECHVRCGCTSDVCPPFDGEVQNSFGVIVALHKVEEDDPFIDPEIFPTSGYYVSLWVEFQLGCGFPIPTGGTGFQTRRDFFDNGIIFFVSALDSNPSDTSHDFSWDDNDFFCPGGTCDDAGICHGGIGDGFSCNNCGLEGIHYSVHVDIGTVI